MFESELCYKTQDIRGWNLKPDILIHGSPCQNFSIAGKQQGADEGSGTQSSLMWETLRIIENLGVWKPRIVIWENVKNVLSKHMRKNFDKYLKRMESLGYTSSFKILNAYDYGLPQKRERVFTISILGSVAFDFEQMKRKEPPHISEFLENNVANHYLVTQPSMIKKIGKSHGSFLGKLNVIDDHCGTITTKQMRCPNAGIISLGDNKYRYLTEKECWRLMGFSDEDYENALAANPSRSGYMNTSLYKQAGNSMPVPVLEAIFREILKGD